MAKQTINIGASPNDGTGTPLRTAFDYTNQNFTELYTATGPSGNNIVVPGNATITGDLTVDTSTLKVDSANNRVGIGTASPTDTLDVNGRVTALRYLSSSSNAALPSFAVSAGNGAYNSGTNEIGFSINSTSAMTLNATGLGVGTSPNHKLQAVGGYVASGRLGSASTGDIGGLLMYCSTDNGGRRSWGLKAESGLTGVLGFWLSSANNTEPFSGSQVMSLDASGRLFVGKTTTGLTVGFEAHNNGYVTSNLAASTDGSATLGVYSTGASASRFYVGMGGTVFATNTTISAISDARLKENVQDIDVGLGAILALKPRKFDWKAGKGKDIKGDRGFIAQEFEQVFPNLIDEWKDQAPEGEAPYKSVRQDLIPVLVKAIQELAAEVNALKNA